MFSCLQEIRLRKNPAAAPAAQMTQALLAERDFFRWGFILSIATRRGEDDAPLGKNPRGSKWDHIFGPHAAKNIGENGAARVSPLAAKTPLPCKLKS